ncbi:protein KRI1 homolog [Phymastichus coffea]|uniref:protein KRI1 homolog n=1 Tax=Phymastichus coffea TaxID=108790 RepID=UPI00273C1CC0|nr:protein KRI1 homolog [Phymastichus coffea]
MPKPKLFDEDDSENVEFKENNDYAKNYELWRRKEEEHKYEAKHGKKIDLKFDSDEETEDSSSEDDEGEGKIPEDFDKCFYKTLACLKTKDPKIYDGDIKFFKEIDTEYEEGKEKENKKELKKQKEKPLFLRDYESKIVLERGGKFSDSENDEEEENARHGDLTYIQEQQEIRNSLKKALQDEDDNEEENLFKPKIKTKEEIQKEEDDYAEFLKGQKQDIEGENVTELKPLRDYWTDPNLDKNEKFLRDYILNNGILDKESDTDFDYEHKVHDSDENLSEDEHNIDKQEQFEHKYNFRFEEPDQEFIKRYPRTLENTLRKKDTRRAQKRAEVKLRKEQEKLQKREELKQLKAMKRKEIEEKLEKLKEITGNDDLPFDILDLDDDYDPEKYDKQMSQVFNKEYYAGEEGDIKPEFPEIDDELFVESTWDNYDPAIDKIVDDDTMYNDGPHCEDPDFNMDADFNEQTKLEDELIESTKKRKRRKRSKFAEMIVKEKPKFDPALYSSYKEYYDQYYALDYEDMIGDLPCRFKYREVVPNDYGLSIEEILMADDKELNKWCSLKKALEYKPEYKELIDVRKFKQKASNEALKKKILKSLYSNPKEETNPAPLELLPDSSKASKKRKKNKKVSDQSIPMTVDVQNPEISKKQKNKNKKLKSNKNEVLTEQNSISSIKEIIDIVPVSTFNTKEKSRISNNNEKQTKVSSQETSTDTITEEKGDSVESSKSNENDSEVQFNNAQKTESAFQKNKKKKKQTNPMDKLHKIKSGGISKPNKQAVKNKSGSEILSKKEQRKQLFKNKNAKLKNKSKDTDQINFLSDERLKAYGFNPKKFKNKLKYGKKK